MSGHLKNYTILFIPDDNTRTFSLRANRRVVQCLIALFVLFVAGAASLVYFSGAIALKLQLVSYLRVENRRLREQNQKLSEATRKIDKMEQMNAYFRRLALESNPAVTPSHASAAAASGEEYVLGEESHDDFIDTMRVAGNTEHGSPRPKPAYSEQFLDAIPNLRPVEGWITRSFSADSAKNRKGHTGVDIAAATGSLIRAAAPGIVSDVSTLSDLGKTVTVRHGYGFETLYGHCSQVLVAPGVHVSRGQTIALVGNTGRSTAPHLHYEIHRDGRKVDPMRFMLNQQFP